jgi:HEXXH motif-containing protein
MEIDLNDHDQLWFPGLAESLVLRHEATAPGQGDHQQFEPHERTQERSDFSRPTLQLGQNVIAIEYPQSAIALRFSELSFAAIDPERARDQLQEAADVLGIVDGLVDTLGLLVRKVYLLEAPVGYDVSHSDPGLPFSIFLSLPKLGETDAALRVAEALLHEAMHLQLTMIEHWVPLITDDLQDGYSPWKHEIRPVGGLLHGLYVFAVIHQTCGLLMRVRDGFRGYGNTRRSEIENEVAVLPEHPRGLSPVGSDVWHKCWHSVLCSGQ